MPRFKQYQKSAFGTSTVLQTNEPFFSPAQQRPGEEPRISLFNVPAPEIYKSPFGISATLYFIKDSFLLDAGNYEAVKQLADELGLIANAHVLVNGYASGEGAADHNQQLSESRRNAVIALLKTSKAIGQPEFSGNGCGSMEPALEETGADEPELESQRRMNRRVEVFISYPPSAYLDKTPAKSLVLRPDALLFWNGTPQPVLEKWLQDDRIGPVIADPQSYQSASDLVSKKISGILSANGIYGKYNKVLTFLIKQGFTWGKGKALDAILDPTGINKDGKEAIKTAADAFYDADIIPEKK